MDWTLEEKYFAKLLSIFLFEWSPPMNISKLCHWVQVVQLLECGDKFIVLGSVAYFELRSVSILAGTV